MTPTATARAQNDDRAPQCADDPEGQPHSATVPARRAGKRHDSDVTDPDPAAGSPTPPPAPVQPPAPTAPAASPAGRAPARQGSWLDKRAKIALAFAAVEGLLLLFGRLSSWVVIAVAVPCVAFYLWRGREMQSGTLRDALWVVAVSQVLIILAAIVSILIGTLVLILLGVFLGVAFLLLWLDEPSRRR